MNQNPLGLGLKKNTHQDTRGTLKRTFPHFSRTSKTAATTRMKWVGFYIMPPMPPMPPIPPGGLGGPVEAPSSSGRSVTMASAVIRRAATLWASTSAVRTTWTRRRGERGGFGEGRGHGHTSVERAGTR